MNNTIHLYNSNNNTTKSIEITNLSTSDFKELDTLISLAQVAPLSTTNKNKLITLANLTNNKILIKFAKNS